MENLFLNNRRFSSLLTKKKQSGFIPQNQKNFKKIAYTPSPAVWISFLGDFASKILNYMNNSMYFYSIHSWLCKLASTTLYWRFYGLLALIVSTRSILRVLKQLIVGSVIIIQIKLWFSPSNCHSDNTITN